MLYIDDDVGFGRLAERTLSRQGLEVAVANDGAAGLALIGEGRFDVVALDHYMPGMEGLEVLAGIRAMANPPPVIYVTGSDEGRIAVAALKAGAADYIVKDIGGAFFDLLIAAIEQALEQEFVRRAKEQAERDVREARDRAEMLLREVNHRVSNSLQLVASLVSMQKSVLGDEAARHALMETQTRITAIAQIHRRLYTSADVSIVSMDTYLEGLIEEIDTAMRVANPRHQLVLAADPILVPTDKAISLGMIVVELVTNALKYAYPEDEGGQIRIRLVREDEQVRLCVEDDGKGLPAAMAEASEGTGLGTRIVKAMARALQARIDTDTGASGTRVALTFPMAA